jgi:hypothetical protein
VRAGARGTVRLAGIVPVPARITSVDPTGPSRSWEWVVGPARMVHRVTAIAGGCEVSIELDAPGPLGPALALSYGPATALLMRNLARVAARETSSR